MRQCDVVDVIWWQSLRFSKENFMFRAANETGEKNAGMKKKMEFIEKWQMRCKIKNRKTKKYLIRQWRDASVCVWAQENWQRKLSINNIISSISMEISRCCYFCRAGWLAKRQIWAAAVAATAASSSANRRKTKQWMAMHGVRWAVCVHSKCTLAVVIFDYYLYSHP